MVPIEAAAVHAREARALEGGIGFARPLDGHTFAVVASGAGKVWLRREPGA